MVHPNHKSVSHSLAARMARIAPSGRYGFTLIELMVVLAILGLLGAMASIIIREAMEKTLMNREMAAARVLMKGMTAYTLEHHGSILPGYRNEPVMGPDGNLLAFPASARYPWRLLPYTGSGAKSVMWANPRGGLESITDSSSEAYAISISPTLGMNVFFVGGDDSGISGQGIRPIQSHYARFGKFCITRWSESLLPSKQLVFASARMPGQQGEVVPGYHMVSPPRLTTERWSSSPYSPDSAPAEYGFVDFRYDGKAVAAMLDGHVALLDEEDMRDMRRWSNLAQKANDPAHNL